MKGFVSFPTYIPGAGNAYSKAISKSSAPPVRRTTASNSSPRRHRETAAANDLHHSHIASPVSFFYDGLALLVCFPRLGRRYTLSGFSNGERSSTAVAASWLASRLGLLHLNVTQQYPLRRSLALLFHLRYPTDHSSPERRASSMRSSGHRHDLRSSHPMCSSASSSTITVPLKNGSISLSSGGVPTTFGRFELKSSIVVNYR